MITVVVMLVNIIVVVVVFVTNVLVDIAMSSKTLVGAPFATAHTTPRSPRQENDTTAKTPDIVQLLLKTRLFDSNHPHSTSQVLPSRRPPRRRLVVHTNRGYGGK